MADSTFVVEPEASPGPSGEDAAETVREDVVEEVRSAFVQLWGSLGSFWGVPPTTARIHSWLLSQAEPVDTEAIMNGLEMSRGAVSMACRELRDWGLIRPEKVPGERRLRYRPATDLEKVIRNIVRVRKQREWDPVLEGLREWIPRLETAQSPEAAAFRSRLIALESLLGAADSLIEGFLKGGLVGRLGLKLLIKTAADESEGAVERSRSADAGRVDREETTT